MLVETLLLCGGFEPFDLSFPVLISTDILVEIWIKFDFIFKTTARKHIIIKIFGIVKYRFIR